MPFITIPDMHNNTYVVSSERQLSTFGANSQLGKTLPVNSVCVSCIGTAGLVSLVSVPSQTNQQINSIIPKEGISPYYIVFCKPYLLKIRSDVRNKDIPGRKCLRLCHSRQRRCACNAPFVGYHILCGYIGFFIQNGNINFAFSNISDSSDVSLAIFSSNGSPSSSCSLIPT